VVRPFKKIMVDINFWLMLDFGQILGGARVGRPYSCARSQ
jgi:hypothetical protein